MNLFEHVLSLVTFVSLFILGPAFGRALLLWWDNRRERSSSSQHVALATFTMISVTGLIVVYGAIWKANPRMVAWYNWLYSIPIDGNVNAEVSGSVDVSGNVSTSQ
jgi:hypothetical protein